MRIVGAIGALAAAMLATSAVEAQHATGCTMTLTGAVTATLACTAAVSFNTSTATAVVAIVVPRAAPLQSVNAAIERPGEPQTGAWKESDKGAVAGIVATAKGDPRRTWIASAGGKGARQGDYTLTLAEVIPGAQTRDGKGYTAHGSLVATLAPDRDSRAAGAVKVRAQF